MKNPFLNTDKYAIVKQYHRISQQKRELSHESNPSSSRSSSSQKQNPLSSIITKIKRPRFSQNRKYHLQYGVFHDKYTQLDLKRKYSSKPNFSKPQEKKYKFGNQVNKKRLLNQKTNIKQGQTNSSIIQEELKRCNDRKMNEERRRISVYGVQQLRYIPNYMKQIDQEIIKNSSLVLVKKEKLFKENPLKENQMTNDNRIFSNQNQNSDKKAREYGHKDRQEKRKNQASDEGNRDDQKYPGLTKKSKEKESMKITEGEYLENIEQAMRRSSKCWEKPVQKGRRNSDQTKGKCDISMFSSNSDNDQILLPSQSQNISQNTDNPLFQNVPDPIKTDLTENYCIPFQHSYTKKGFTHTLHQLQDKQNPGKSNLKQKSRSICTLQSSKKSQFSYTGTLLNIKNQQYGFQGQENLNGAFQRSGNRYQSIFPFPLTNMLQSKINSGSSSIKRTNKRKSSVFEQLNKNSNSGSSNQFKFSDQIAIEGSTDEVKSQISVKQSVLPPKMSNFYTPTLLNKSQESLEPSNSKYYNNQIATEIDVRGKIYFLNQVYHL